MKFNTLLEIDNVCKYFLGTNALDGVSIAVKEGQIVGLVGENGAGKSTLLKIIAGIEKPSSGKMYVRGKEYHPNNPRNANDLGIGMVFQEQSLITNLSVARNIYLGREKAFKKFGFVMWNEMYKTFEKYSSYLGIKGINAKTKVNDLSFVSRQMVEIMRVLNLVQQSGYERTLVLLDEPTSVLNGEEIDQLFSQIRKLKAEGNSVIFVSHRLEEVIELCDVIYIFCDGKNVGVVNKEEANEQILYQKMVGKSSPAEYYCIAEQAEPAKEVVLEVKNLGLWGKFRDVSFKLRKGETLGICGVVGSGKEDVCDVICGDERKTSGNLFLDGKDINIKEPYKALNYGILSIPKERKTDAIIESISIKDNIILSNFRSVKNKLFISSKKQARVASEWVEKLNIRCKKISDKVEQLSGGNAQKVAFARVLCSSAKILILNHPTRGIDIGAKVDIYKIIRKIVKTGISIILLGDTLEECIGLSNRVLVMKDGEIVKEFNAEINNKPTKIDIIKYMM